MADEKKLPSIRGQLSGPRIHIDSAAGSIAIGPYRFPLIECYYLYRDEPIYATWVVDTSDRDKTTYFSYYDDEIEVGFQDASKFFPMRNVLVSGSAARDRRVYRLFSVKGAQGIELIDKVQGGYHEPLIFCALEKDLRKRVRSLVERVLVREKPLKTGRGDLVATYAASVDLGMEVNPELPLEFVHKVPMDDHEAFKNDITQIVGMVNQELEVDEGAQPIVMKEIGPDIHLYTSLSNSTTLMRLRKFIDGSGDEEFEERYRELVGGHIQHYLTEVKSASKEQRRKYKDKILSDDPEARDLDQIMSDIVVVSPAYVLDSNFERAVERIRASQYVTVLPDTVLTHDLSIKMYKLRDKIEMAERAVKAVYEDSLAGPAGELGIVPAMVWLPAEEGEAPMLDMVAVAIDLYDKLNADERAKRDEDILASLTEFEKWLSIRDEAVSELERASAERKSISDSGQSVWVLDNARFLIDVVFADPDVKAHMAVANEQLKNPLGPDSSFGRLMATAFDDRTPKIIMGKFMALSAAYSCMERFLLEEWDIRVPFRKLMDYDSYLGLSDEERAVAMNETESLNSLSGVMAQMQQEIEDAGGEEVASLREARAAAERKKKAKGDTRENPTERYGDTTARYSEEDPGIVEIVSVNPTERYGDTVIRYDDDDPGIVEMIAINSDLRRERARIDSEHGIKTAQDAHIINRYLVEKHYKLRHRNERTIDG